jgi:thiamine pyrophosphate-dependent acetolactate synthase large subunit-like protein
MKVNNMPTLTGAEAAVRKLELNGVRHIFGLCGDTSLPFYDALAVSITASRTCSRARSAAPRTQRTVTHA